MCRYYQPTYTTMAETLPQVVVETDPFMDINMERFRLDGITGKEGVDMELQIQKKPERSWGTIIFNSIWYIVFLVLVLTTLVRLSI